MHLLKNDRTAVDILKQISMRRNPADSQNMPNDDGLEAEFVRALKRYYEATRSKRAKTRVSEIEALKELIFDKIEIAVKQYQELIGPKRLLMTEHLTFYYCWYNLAFRMALYARKFECTLGLLSAHDPALRRALEDYNNTVVCGLRSLTDEKSMPSEPIDYEQSLSYFEMGHIEVLGKAYQRAVQQTGPDPQATIVALLEVQLDIMTPLERP